MHRARGGRQVVKVDIILSVASAYDSTCGCMDKVKEKRHPCKHRVDSISTQAQNASFRYCEENSRPLLLVVGIPVAVGE